MSPGASRMLTFLLVATLEWLDSPKVLNSSQNYSTGHSRPCPLSTVQTSSPSAPIIPPILQPSWTTCSSPRARLLAPELLHLVSCSFYLDTSSSVAWVYTSKIKSLFFLTRFTGLELESFLVLSCISLIPMITSECKRLLNYFFSL